MKAPKNTRKSNQDLNETGGFFSEGIGAGKRGQQEISQYFTRPSTSFSPYRAPALKSELSWKNSFNSFLFNKEKSDLPTSSM